MNKQVFIVFLFDFEKIFNHRLIIAQVNKNQRDRGTRACERAAAFWLEINHVIIIYARIYKHAC